MLEDYFRETSYIVALLNFKPSLLATARDRITGLTQGHCSYKRNKLLRYNWVEIRI